MARRLNKRLDRFIDYWLEKWRSSRVDVKIKGRGRITPIRVTIVVYRDDENNNVLCEC